MVQENKRKMSKKGFKIFYLIGIIVIVLVLFGLLVYAVNENEQNKYEKKYKLQKYNTDSYKDTVDYNEDGVIQEAESSQAGEENDDWGEGNGFFNEIKDKDGNVLWTGVSKTEYDKMTNEQKKEITEKYDKAIESVMESGASNDMTEDTPISDMLYNGTVYENISSLCADYNEGIPFSYKGRSYEIGFNLQKDGFDNSQYPVGQGYGLDGLGYLIWMYRNALGYTPEQLKGTFSCDRLEKNKIAFEDLKIGDICITEKSDKDIVYGVVAGFYDDNVIVSVCDNEACEKFPYGCNHLVYVKSQNDKVLGNFQPVDFNYFYRLDDLMGEK